MKYTVSKEKGGQWYVHPIDDKKSPVPGSYGSKKEALKTAAKLNGIPLKDFLKYRKGENNE